MTQNSNDEMTHFGFQSVRASEKAARVREIFDSVASRYDVMNDLMSGGVHRIWKDAFVSWLDPRPGRQYLDVAGGTGDIAFRILRSAARQPTGGQPPATVTVCDINEEMLRVGRDRAMDHALSDGLSWVVGDAQALPLPDRSVDAYTIAFGLRNVTRIEDAIADARRVLRPGGKMMILEFSKVVIPVFDRLYDLYSFKALPLMGRFVAGDEDAYRYLVESIRRFPPQDELARKMEEAGFRQVQYRNLTGGIAAMHVGWRL
ncbi:bifunctional demethylmenaquinone methyltransferase/2-methoxy-6-polyprenyl-1,4-benzoquinol methylase UbiE [Phaeovibrio sulfidiphilus]|uniref:Ubiquinone/menaquinone biosynthesis C-methyltransferase UbiE n=1 Tax=Phaeovibrio sulfidiphilus TaxID=1220600 RepID=A0A8J6YME0_9PROT|nr:bifunctional demethylmenaquinone methyltransferase/2-methoxy-6-polyprenyl-1,4-benzoquinol methylase UbiE [Phaeovibrio sulfidiphilus]MBE1237100.1 bifunctional demethylmenaquinone methyltransferase/2-methoxy-6-polyprenyl-1,4-benzoquinol methylase UbiE [Phaeovibrio sulfidiphilus]